MDEEKRRESEQGREERRGLETKSSPRDKRDFGPVRRRDDGRRRRDVRERPYQDRRAPRREEYPRIDREKTCPLLLRVFLKFGEHNSPDEYSFEEKTPSTEVKVYTWKDATLKELSTKIQSVCEEAKDPSAQFSFMLVYPDDRGKMRMREIGKTYASRRSEDDRKSLQLLRFRTGDFFDVCITK